MKVPLSLLKEYIHLELSSDKIASVLTLAGIEVDAVHVIGSTFSGVVVGEVLEAVQHPSADRLRVAKVTDGKEVFQVVCGAANCRAGIKTPFAKIGAKLDSGAFNIKKAKLRDVESFGMLCSSDELQLGSSEGIMELPSEWETGKDIAFYFRDEIFELSLTPNLGHCLSVKGIARELSAHLNIPMQKPDWDLKEEGKAIDIQVDVQDRKQCGRYACRLVREVVVGPSPDWLKRRIEACGLRSINNVVDVGNLVMLELGQPLHLFDRAKIQGNTLYVTSHTNYKSMQALDGKTYDIPPSTLLICDASAPLAFAGIMGGEESKVSERTKEVLIESAYFMPTSIRKSCRLLQLKSDSSSRFEKGVDPQGVVEALDYAAYLLSKVSGGKVAQGLVDIQVHPDSIKKVCCRTERVNRLLGTTLSTSEITAILNRLSMQVVDEGAHQVTVIVPPFRHDVEKEIDLVEEVARVYGYNNIPKRAPKQRLSTLLNAPLYEIEKNVKHCLVGQGLQEWMTCDLISPKEAELGLMHGMTKENLVAVLQAHSIDQSVLRTTLLPAFLRIARYNIDHGTPDLAAFEVGRIHFKESQEFLEPTVAAVLLTGHSAPYHFDSKPRDFDFFDLKGVFQNLLSYLSIHAYRLEVSHYPHFHPYRQAKVFCGETLIGVLGEVHPNHCKNEGIEQKLFFGEINLHALLPLIPKEKQVSSIALFPGSERDWTVTVDQKLSLEELLMAIKSTASPLLERVFLLGLYKSSQMGEDKKNVTLRFSYRDKEKTVSFEEVESEHGRIIKEVLSKL
ncbi:MAG: phenylalanyl-tRNA synthetase beta chain [Chlamydiota bacterium]|jgi:phenylalanyl-tRNA synthetase beta chain